MKMTFTFIAASKIEYIGGKDFGSAHAAAVKKFGEGNVSDFRRWYENENTANHKRHFLKRGISNILKHQHKTNRKGFKQR